MSKENKSMTNKLVDIIVEEMQNIKAKEIVVIDLSEIENAVCKYFVIAHGTSKTHASSIASAVKKEVAETMGDRPWKDEGFSNGEWVLLDYSDVVVHVFQEHTREFYSLEELWGDAPIKVIEEA